MEIFNLQIFTNIDCNLNCTYCYEHIRDVKNLNVNNIKEYINLSFKKYSIEYKTFKIHFKGGEPFLHSYLINDIIKYSISKSKEYGINVFFHCNTNATLIYKSKYIQDILLEYKDILFLGISIDGNKQYNDLNRKYLNGKGSYEDIIKSIEWLRENYNINNLELRITPVHNNINNLFSSLKELIDLNITDIVFNLVYEEKWTLNDGIILLKHLIESIEYIIDNNKNNKFYFVNYGNKYNAKIKGNYCGICNNTICLGKDNLIYPCNKFYILFNKDLAIYDNEINIINQNLINEIYSMYNNYTDDCKQCDINNECALCIASIYKTNIQKFFNDKNICGWSYAIKMFFNYCKQKNYNLMTY